MFPCWKGNLGKITQSKIQGCTHAVLRSCSEAFSAWCGGFFLLLTNFVRPSGPSSLLPQSKLLQLTATGKRSPSLFISGPSVLLLQPLVPPYPKFSCCKSWTFPAGESQSPTSWGAPAVFGDPHKNELWFLAHTPVLSRRSFLLHLASIHFQSCPMWPWPLGYVSSFPAWKKARSLSWRGTLR